MKKLMIALAAVALAVGANAAVVKWNSGALTDSKGAAITAANKITAYVYEISAAQFDTYSAMNGETLSKTIAGVFGTENMPGTLDISGNNTFAKGNAAANLTGKTDHSAGTSAYGLIVYQDLTNEGWYMANVVEAPFASAQDVTISELSTKLGGSADNRGATAWAQASAVPEPTSGLLLLLGMAGLALRRRRA